MEPQDVEKAWEKMEENGSLLKTTGSFLGIAALAILLGIFITLWFF